jgi:katanin p60 ATPase-containing subunit A1
MSTNTAEHNDEASRRIKTERLTQMDGLVQSDALVFVLATINCPDLLDPALLRRLEKRVFVPLAEDEARNQLFINLLTQYGDSNLDGVDLSDMRLDLITETDVAQSITKNHSALLEV